MRLASSRASIAPTASASRRRDPGWICFIGFLPWSTGRAGRGIRTSIPSAAIVCDFGLKHTATAVKQVNQPSRSEHQKAGSGSCTPAPSAEEWLLLVQSLPGEGQEGLTVPLMAWGIGEGALGSWVARFRRIHPVAWIFSPELPSGTPALVVSPDLVPRKRIGERQVRQRQDCEAGHLTSTKAVGE
ncbi:hypothetical protein GCM10023080_022370 [Streptomyces pseudoechinosporeus]